jgi:hypothetical protein
MPRPFRPASRSTTLWLTASVTQTLLNRCDCFDWRPSGAQIRDLRINMNVNLTQKLEEWVRQKVESGFTTPPAKSSGKPYELCKKPSSCGCEIGSVAERYSRRRGQPPATAWDPHDIKREGREKRTRKPRPSKV